MAIVKKKSADLFPDVDFETPEQHFNLLSTIRVPKNLLYLTDRLPKPNYNSSRKIRGESDEPGYRTYEGPQQGLLPNIRNHQ
jgi:hypothetical protein